MSKLTTVSLLKNWWYWYVMEMQIVLQQPRYADICLKQCKSLKSSVLAAFDSYDGLCAERDVRKRAFEMLTNAHRWSPALRLTPIFAHTIIHPVLVRCRAVKLTNETYNHDYARACMLNQLHQRRRNCLKDLLTINNIELGTGNESDADLDRSMICFEQHPQWLTDGRPCRSLKRSIKVLQTSGVQALILSDTASIHASRSRCIADESAKARLGYKAC